MNSQKIIFLFLVMIAAIFGVGFYLTITRVDIFLKNSAIDSCLKSASYSSEVGNESGKNTTNEPIKQWFDFCMKEKGY